LPGSLRAWYPEMGDEAARDIAQSLFTIEGRELEAAGAVRAHVRMLYERLWRAYERREDGKWRPVVMEYLSEHEASPPWRKGKGGRFFIP
jgi:hypothetical protein